MEHFYVHSGHSGAYKTVCNKTVVFRFLKSQWTTFNVFSQWTKVQDGVK